MDRIFSIDINIVAVGAPKEFKINPNPYNFRR